MQSYTDKNQAILSFLNDQQLKEGGYILPGMPDGATMDDHEKAVKEQTGKPWASIQYHSKLENDMVINMIRGFLVDMVIIFLFCWLLGKMTAPSFQTIVTSAIVVGLIVFLNAPYTGFIWYKSFDIWASFGDAIVSWGLAGVWLAWWMRRQRPELSTLKVGEQSTQMTN